MLFIQQSNIFNPSSDAFTLLLFIIFLVKFTFPSGPQWLPMFNRGLWSPFPLILQANLKSYTQCSPHPMHASGVSVVAMFYDSSWQNKRLNKLAQVVKREIGLAQGMYLGSDLEWAMGRRVRVHDLRKLGCCIRLRAAFGSRVQLSGTQSLVWCGTAQWSWLVFNEKIA